MESAGLKLGFWENGPKPGQFYSFPSGSHTSGSGPTCGPVRHTLNPMVTGTSVLGVKFTGGVIIAADMLGSYGSLARFRNISRLMKVNSSTILGASGDYADYQYLKQTIEQMVIDEELLGDGHSYSPKAVHSWLLALRAIWGVQVHVYASDAGGNTMMSVMKRAAMLLMLAAISGNMASDPENCGSVRATVSPKDHSKILGDWVLVEAFGTDPEGDQYLKNASSSHVKFLLLPDNNIEYTEKNLYQNKSCTKYFASASIPSDSADHMHVHVPSWFHQDGAVMEMNVKANVTFYETCEDCLILVYKGDLGLFLLAYRREGHHHDVSQLTKDHSEHKKLAACLGMHYDGQYHYDSTADFCV